MRFMPRLHDTYVGQVVLVTVLLAWAGFKLILI